MAGPGPYDPIPRAPGGKLVERAPWATFRRELGRFIAKAGTAHVPAGHTTAGGYRLGYQCGLYRAAKRNGHLPEANAQWLEAQPGWAWNLRGRPGREMKDNGWAAA